MPVDRMSGTENYRADQTIKNANNVSGPSGGGADVGGRDNPRAEQNVKAAGNKAGGPTSGPTIGGTTEPGTTIKGG
jgi:hypothetical protein